jgi:hypothetical protein
MAKNKQNNKPKSKPKHAPARKKKGAAKGMAAVKALVHAVEQAPRRQNGKKKSRNRKRKNKGNNGDGHINLKSSGMQSTITNSGDIIDSFNMRFEKIAPVYGTAGFVNSIGYTPTVAGNGIMYINPGNALMFPSFAATASTYTEFFIEHLEFFYQTKSFSATSTGASAGSVNMVTNYDPSAAAFTSTLQIMGYQGGTTNAPYTNNSHLCCSKDKIKKGWNESESYLVNSSANTAVPAGTDNENIFKYNAGTFQLATEGNAVTSIIGDLYVKYKFTMVRPKIPLYLSSGPLVAHIQTTPGSTSTIFSSAGNSAKGGSSSQLGNSTAAGNTITINSSPSLSGTQVKVDIYAYQTGTSPPQLGISTLTNCTLFNSYYENDNLSWSATQGVNNNTSGATYVSHLSAGFTLNSNSATILISLTSGTVTGQLFTDVFLTSMPQSLVGVSLADEVDHRLKRLEDLEARIERKLALLDTVDDEWGSEESKSSDPPPSCTSSPPGSKPATPSSISSRR